MIVGGTAPAYRAHPVFKGMKHFLSFLFLSLVFGFFFSFGAPTLQAQTISVSPPEPNPGDEITITAEGLNPGYKYLVQIRNTADDSIIFTDESISSSTGSLQVRTSLAKAGNYSILVIDRATAQEVAAQSLSVAGASVSLSCGDICPASSSCSDTDPALCPCSCSCAWNGVEWTCGGTAPVPPAPTTDCVDTALGCMPTDVKGLAEWFLKLGSGLAGAIAVLLITIGGLKIMTSQGDPEAVEGGKEMITAAISGLLFVIFSGIILEIVGIKVLGF